MGSPPKIFSETLHVGRPNIGNREKLSERINGILDRRWLTNNGPMVKEFENRLADYLGVRNVVAMCNATVALEIASKALDFQGEVILPSYTFVATAHALQWQGITPVFADIDPARHTIDPASIEKMITPRTTGILGVHLWGRACDVEAIDSIAKKYHLKVMYDASHALGCTDKGRMIGAAGECEVFSFHGTKFINSFEGGAVVTNDDVLAEKMRLMRNFGFKGVDNVIYLGINGKMNEVCAAMGLTSLESIDYFMSLNRRNFESYRSGLQGVPGVSLIRYDPAERNNFQYVVVEIDAKCCPLTRDSLVDILHSENVAARKYFWPGCHRMEPYRSLYPHAGLLLPETNRLASQILLLPTGETITPEIIDIICGIIRKSCEREVQQLAF